MDLKLRGAVVLITGGNRGLGAALALAFAGEGARVAICARDEERLEQVGGKIRAAGAECLTLAADLLDPDACREVVDRTASAFGRFDALINNASANVDSTPDSLEAATDAQVLARIDGKAMPAIRCARAAIPHMRRNAGGRIVNIGGAAARAVSREPGAVSGFAQGIGNAALANFSKYLSEEVARYNILVNIVHPSRVRTERWGPRIAAMAKEFGITEKEAEARAAGATPIGRMIEPAELAPIVLLLASAANTAITGQALAVDGGAMSNVQY